MLIKYAKNVLNVYSALTKSSSNITVIIYSLCGACLGVKTGNTCPMAVEIV